MAIERQWEEFQVGPRDVENGLHVTLDTKGTILLGAKTQDRWGKFSHVVLLFDKVTQTIGLLPSDSRVPNAYECRPKSKGRHRTIRAARLCRHYGINIERTVAFVDPSVDKDGVLVLDLRRTRGIGKPKA